MADALDRSSSALPIRLHLLGGFGATRAGKPIVDTDWQRLTARVVVKLLAVEPNHRLHRDQLLDAIWPDLDTMAGAANFRNALHRARHTLEPELPPKGLSSYLLLSDEVLMFSHLVTVDADQFEFLGRRALSTEDIASYEAALATYGGELLPEDLYLDRVSARRVFLAGLHGRLLRTLAGILERRGAYESAAERLQQALREDPTCEDIHLRLMRLYSDMGRRHDALRQYQDCVTVMRNEMGTDLEPATVAYYQKVLVAKSNVPRVGREQRTLLPRAVARAPSTPFVGREDLLEFILSVLDAARDGSGSSVLVSGEAGMGKSRLAAETAREAQRRGALVLWGASHEHEGLKSYGPIIDALEGYLSHLLDDELHELATRHHSLAHLLPTLARYVDPISLPRAIEQFDGRYFYSAVAHFLEALSRVRPVVLILDDLHLADTASLDLLASLARSASEHRLVVLGSYRDEDVIPGSRLYHLAAEFAREGIGRRVCLLQLSQTDSNKLAQALLGDLPAKRQVLDYIFKLSAGNPLFLHVLIDSLRDANGLFQHAGDWRVEHVSEVDVPLRVRELIEGRLQNLEEDDRHALGLAAVAGGEFTFATLLPGWQEMVGEEREGVLLERLERGIGIGILEEREDGYAFRHPLYQATIYGRLSQHRKAAYHKAVAHSVERVRPEEVETLAHHYRRAGVADKAAVYLERAGDRAQRLYAGASAELHFRDALVLLDRTEHSRDGARVRVKLGSVLILLSQYDDALVVLEQAAEVYQGENDQTGLVEALGQIGLAHFHRGSAEEGLTRLQPFLPRLEQQQETVGVAVLYLAFSHLYFARGQYKEQLAASIRASELAEATGEMIVRAQAETRRGTALLMLGDATAGREVLEGAIPLTEAIGDLDGLSRTLNNLAHSFLIGGQLRRHLEFGERALEVMKQVGDPVRIALYHASVGQTWYFLGDWSRARELIELGISELQTLPKSWHSAYPLYFLGQLHFHEGDWDQAWRLLEESATIAQSNHDMQALRLSSLYLAEIELLQGRTSEARERLAPLVGEAATLEKDGNDLDQLLLMAILAWAEVERGDFERAETLIRPVVERVEAENLQLYRGITLSIYGIVLTAQARWNEAEDVLNEAQTLAKSMQYPFLEAETLRLKSLLFVRNGHEARGRECLDEAHRIFHWLGADRYASHLASTIANS